ncbi:MAG TPA: hypothetical protein VGA95_09230 [Thermodesulfobacteriota bacterium]
MFKEALIENQQEPITAQSIAVEGRVIPVDVRYFVGKLLQSHE